MKRIIFTLLFLSISNKAPAVTFELKDDGWYQLQNAETYETVCETVIPNQIAICEVPAGEYFLVNHSISPDENGHREIVQITENSDTELPGFYTLEQTFTNSDDYVGSVSVSCFQGDIAISGSCFAPDGYEPIKGYLGPVPGAATKFSCDAGFVEQLFMQVTCAR